MLNHIWAAMLIIGFLYGMITGNLPVMTNSMLEAAKDAVDLSITLLGVVAFWCGIMEIAQEAGLVDILSCKMWPIIHFLFSDIPEEHESLKAISLNFIANILGLGWAATPAGLNAMEELKMLEEERQEYDLKILEEGSQEYDLKILEEGNQEYDLKILEEGSQRYDEDGNLGGKRKSKSKILVASNEMCTFLVLNISSLQLIPVNVIAYRSQYGSENPALVVGPAIIATTASTVVAVIFCKIMNKRR